jgi:predicted metal-dependent enzyme (double-stranded beta helix superfamily)
MWYSQVNADRENDPVPETNECRKEFVEHLHDIVYGGGSNEQTVAAVKDLVTTTLGTTGWLPERCLEPAPECYARHLLYQDPDMRFAVVVMVWQPGQRTPIHDHGGVWCVEGVYQGRIRVKRYDLEGAAENGIAHMHCREILEAGIGAAGALIPPVDYHRIENPFDVTAITVHTYGGEMKACHVFTPRADGAYDIEVHDLVYTSRPTRLAAGAPITR